MTVGYRLAWWLQSHRVDPGIQLFRANFRRWILASLGAAMLTWFMLKIANSALPPPDPIDTATALTVLAPLALAVVHVLQTSLYVALRRETEIADLDREWLGRVNGMILRLAVGWTVFALGCLILPLLVSLVQAGQWSGGGISTMGALTMLIGGLAAWLGKIWPSVEALADKPVIHDRVRAYLPSALGVLFAACLLVVFGGVVNFVLAQLQLGVGAVLRLGDVTDQPKSLSADPPGAGRQPPPLLLPQFVSRASNCADDGGKLEKPSHYGAIILNPAVGRLPVWAESAEQ